MIVLALAVATAGFLITPTRYVITSSMLLTTPAAGGTLNADPDIPVGLTNPLLQFSDGLRTTAGMLILAVNGPQAQRDIGVVEGGSTEVTIDDGRSNPDLLGISGNGPYIYVKVDSDSAATARSIMERARQRISAELVERQRQLRAPTSTHISILDVVPPLTPKAEIEGKVQAAGVGLVLTIVLGFGIAYLARRRGLFERFERFGSGGDEAEAEADADASVVTVTSADPEDDPEESEESEESEEEDSEEGDSEQEEDPEPEKADVSENGAVESEDHRALLVSDDGIATGPIDVIRVGSPSSDN
ncbi:hypothetical protein HII36_11815 [Nonomuraea sp. NN258]|uniref:hypothetical protein n=1 Tax=Nonomuraea antri TaxID=2730852 RepID=UPI0015682E04|nr:hypothetical protein [Nonomuraea antri]NRQ32520.1 hypothetical protein [Nonomuraea antri]